MNDEIYDYETSLDTVFHSAVNKIRDDIRIRDFIERNFLNASIEFIEGFCAHIVCALCVEQTDEEPLDVNYTVLWNGIGLGNELDYYYDEFIDELERNNYRNKEQLEQNYDNRTEQFQKGFDVANQAFKRLHFKFENSIDAFRRLKAEGLRGYHITIQYTVDNETITIETFISNTYTSMKLIYPLYVRTGQISAMCQGAGLNINWYYMFIILVIIVVVIIIFVLNTNKSTSV